MDRPAALAALRWWVDAGVDTLCADTPTSWLRPVPATATAPAPAERAEPVQAEPTRTPRTSPQLATANAGTADPAAIARAADTPAALLAAARAFAGPHALLYDGPADNGLLFVTEAPTHDDVRAQHLFAGDPGRLVDAMLAAIGLGRTTVMLATAALQPGGDAQEIAFLHRLIALTRPRALVALGGPATARLTQDTRGLNRLRGQWVKTSIGNKMFHVLPTFSPAHLIAHPHHKALAWADLLTLKASLAA